MSVPIAKTILLVDDEPLLLKLVRTILEKAGYSVLAAASPKEASLIDQDCKETIDLLLTAFSLQPISGFELAVLLKWRRPGLRVMLMSGDPDAPILARANGWSFTAKPFAISDLLREIEDVLAQDAATAVGSAQSEASRNSDAEADAGGSASARVKRPWNLSATTRID